MSDIDAAPRFDRWGGETTEDRIVSAFAALERALAARHGHIEHDEEAGS